MEVVWMCYPRPSSSMISYLVSGSSANRSAIIRCPKKRGGGSKIKHTACCLFCFKGPVPLIKSKGFAFLNSVLTVQYQRGLYLLLLWKISSKDQTFGTARRWRECSNVQLWCAFWMWAQFLLNCREISLKNASLLPCWVARETLYGQGGGDQTINLFIQIN